MPELPDVALYVHALSARVVGRTLRSVRIRSPFLVRSIDPPVDALNGRTVVGVERIGKRIVLACDGDLFAVIHLMIAGRFHWKPARVQPRSRATLAVFEFDNGSLVLTEAGSKRRASLMVVCGRAGLATLGAGGLDVLTASAEAFASRLRAENHTLKRALTDPRLFDAIGNAYSDEILHAACLSPLALTSKLSDQQVARLHAAAKATLTSWIDQLRTEAGEAFPEKVTAFRDGMAVHGRYGKPCPRCGALVQRITYADRECNYCAACQVGGRLLADRALSRLLREDWPKTLEELEEYKDRRRA